MYVTEDTLDMIVAEVKERLSGRPWTDREIREVVDDVVDEYSNSLNAMVKEELKV